MSLHTCSNDNISQPDAGSVWAAADLATPPLLLDLTWRFLIVGETRGLRRSPHRHRHRESILTQHKKDCCNWGLSPQPICCGATVLTPPLLHSLLAHLVISVWAKTSQVPHLSLHPVAFFSGLPLLGPLQSLPGEADGWALFMKLLPPRWSIKPGSPLKSVAGL